MKKYTYVFATLTLLTIHTMHAADSIENIAPTEEQQEQITVEQWLPYSTDEYEYSRREDTISKEAAQKISPDLSTKITTSDNIFNTGKTTLKFSFEPVDEKLVKIIVERWTTKKVGYATTANIVAGSLAATMSILLAAKMLWGLHSLTPQQNDDVLNTEEEIDIDRTSSPLLFLNNTWNEIRNVGNSVSNWFGQFSAYGGPHDNDDENDPNQVINV